MNTVASPYFLLLLPLAFWLMGTVTASAWLFCRTQRYLLWHAGAAVLCGVVFAFQILRPPDIFIDYLPWLAGIYGAMLAGLAQAVALRFGQSISLPWAGALIVLTMFCEWMFSAVHNHLVARMAILALCGALIMLHGMHRIWRAPRRRRIDQALWWLYLVCTVLVLVRPLPVVVEWLQGSDPHFDFVQSLQWLITMLVSLVVGFGFCFLLFASAFTDSMQRLRQERDRDPLTGLYNRRALMEMAQQGELSPHPGAWLVMCDLDHFKPINDRWGHAVGDAVLHAVAQVLSHQVRLHDVVARLGGEEFLIVLRGVDQDAALLVITRIREQLAQTQVAALDTTTRITGSFGAVRWHASETLAQAVDRADQFMYQAKQDGRNRVRWEGQLRVVPT